MTTQKQTRHTCTLDVKRDAVSRAARSLDINDNVLRRWKREFEEPASGLDTHTECFESAIFPTGTKSGVWNRYHVSVDTESLIVPVSVVIDLYRQLPGESAPQSALGTTPRQSVFSAV